MAAVELVGGEGVEDDGERDLDGLAVFERAEVERGGRGAGDRVAVGGVALVEAGVEVAVRRAVELGRAALEAVGADVAADRDFHEGSLRGVPPRGVGGYKLNGCKKLAKWVSLKYCNHWGYL